MATLRERLKGWKEKRSPLQKAGDIFFWILLVLLILPGPRKVIMTSVNRVVLNVKNPGIRSEEKQVELGNLDYNWAVGMASGEQLHMSDMLGEVVFLNFWATWCPPCVAELPEIQKAYEKHGDEVAFITIATDREGPEVVVKFMEERGYTFPVFYPVPPIPDLFQSPSIPTTFVISREGKIVTKKTGSANWDSKAADRMFGELVR